MQTSFFAKLFGLFRPHAKAASLLGKFSQDRVFLEEQFFQKARTAGIPRGLRWVKCDWLSTRVLLKEKATAQVCLLVGVNISFEAVEGSDMENVAAVSLVRDACAVFQLTTSGWQTSGRALFNMNPTEATDKLGASYEPYE